MKFFLTVAATLLAGTMMFQSCAEQDNALNPYFEELKDGQDLADAIKYHNEAGTVKLPAGAPNDSQ